MTDREWKQAMATIESLRHQLINSAGISNAERSLLRMGLCQSLRFVARKIEEEQIVEEESK